MGNDIEEETTAGGIMDTGNEEVKMGQEEDQNPAFVQYQEDNNERYQGDDPIIYFTNKWL